MGHSILVCLEASYYSSPGLVLPGSSDPDSDRSFQWDRAFPIHSSGCPNCWMSQPGPLRRKNLAQTRCLGQTFHPLKWFHGSPRQLNRYAHFDGPEATGGPLQRTHLTSPLVKQLNGHVETTETFLMVVMETAVKSKLIYKPVGFSRQERIKGCLTMLAHDSEFPWRFTIQILNRSNPVSI